MLSTNLVFAFIIPFCWWWVLRNYVPKQTTNNYLLNQQISLIVFDSFLFLHVIWFLTIQAPLYSRHCPCQKSHALYKWLFIWACCQVDSLPFNVYKYIHSCVKLNRSIMFLFYLSLLLILCMIYMYKKCEPAWTK